MFAIYNKNCGAHETQCSNSIASVVCMANVRKTYTETKFMLEHLISVIDITISMQLYGVIVVWFDFGTLFCHPHLSYWIKRNPCGYVVNVLSCCLCLVIQLKCIITRW